MTPGKSTSFTIQLNTNALGVFGGEVSFVNNDGFGNNFFQFDITGTVLTPPKITVLGGPGNGAAIVNGESAPEASNGADFGSEIQNLAGPTQTYLVRNDGQETLVLGQVVLPAGFALVEAPDGTVGENQSTSFTVQLNTNAPGVFGGEVSFTNNDGYGNSPFDFNITGTVLTPTVVNSIAAPPIALPGQSSSYTASFTGGGTHVAAWNWGDGTTSPGVVAEANGAGTATASHVYAGGKTYTITVALTEESTGFLAAASKSLFALKASGASLLADPLNPAKTALYVCGGSGDDTILFGQIGPKGTVQVAINGHIIGSYAPTGHLIAYGLDGNNTIMVGGKIALPAWLLGGGINDTLVGGGGMNLLIGGCGKNQIKCGPGKNTVLPASFALAANFESLCATVAQWEAGKATSSPQTAAPQIVVASGSQASAASQALTKSAAAGVQSGAADALFSAGAIPANPASASVASSALDAVFAKPSAALPNKVAESLPKISLASPAPPKR